MPSIFLYYSLNIMECRCVQPDTSDTHLKRNPTECVLVCVILKSHILDVLHIGTCQTCDNIPEDYVILIHIFYD